MSCTVCGSYVDTHGRCYDKVCDNFRGRQKLPKSKTNKRPRARLRPISDKQAELGAKTKGMRWAPIIAGTVCDYCQAVPATAPHEITAGPGHRSLAMQDIRAICWVCGPCHERIQGIPYPEQAAIAARAVIGAINRCTGNQSVAVDGLIKELQRGES